MMHFRVTTQYFTPVTKQARSAGFAGSQRTKADGGLLRLLTGCFQGWVLCAPDFTDQQTCILFKI